MPNEAHPLIKQHMMMDDVLLRRQDKASRTRRVAATWSPEASSNFPSSATPEPELLSVGVYAVWLQFHCKVSITVGCRCPKLPINKYYRLSYADGVDDNDGDCSHFPTLYPRGPLPRSARRQRSSTRPRSKSVLPVMHAFAATALSSSFPVAGSSPSTQCFK